MYNVMHALPARPYHIPCYCPPGHSINHAITHKAIPYTMSCQPGHNIYHAISARPNHMPGHTSGHNIYHAMSGLSHHYHTSCHGYPGNTIYHAMPSQAIPNTMLWHKQCQVIPYILPCSPGHTIYRAIPTGHTIYHVMPARTYHIPCIYWGARWLSGRVSDSGARGPGFETYRRRVVFLSKTLYSPKVLVNYPGSDGSVPT